MYLLSQMKSSDFFIASFITKTSAWSVRDHFEEVISFSWHTGVICCWMRWMCLSESHIFTYPELNSSKSFRWLGKCNPSETLLTTNLFVFVFSQESCIRFECPRIIYTLQNTLLYGISQNIRAGSFRRKRDKGSHHFWIGQIGQSRDSTCSQLHCQRNGLEWNPMELKEIMNSVCSSRKRR